MTAKYIIEIESDSKEDIELFTELLLEAIPEDASTLYNVDVEITDVEKVGE